MTTRVNWPGRSGAEYETELFPFGTTFNPVSGVYIACGKSHPGQWKAFYVGEAKSLYDRLNTNVAAHDGLVRAARSGATHFAVMRTNNDTARLRIETDLRHALNPVCNRQSVPIKSLLGSLSAY